MLDWVALGDAYTYLRATTADHLDPRAHAAQCMAFACEAAYHQGYATAKRVLSGPPVGSGALPEGERGGESLPPDSQDRKRSGCPHTGATERILSERSSDDVALQLGTCPSCGDTVILVVATIARQAWTSGVDGKPHTAACGRGKKATV